MSRTNAERASASRATLIEVGRRLFGQHGFAATSTPMIAEAAGVSRGALYHHFKDKADLFAAVVEAEFARLAEAINAAATEASDPLEKLIEGGENFITAASDPVSQKLLFIDGPAVLGNGMLHAVDTDTTTNTLLIGIEEAQAAGRLPRDLPAAALTSMMSGAYDRAVIDGFGADEAGRLAIRHAIRSLWEGLSKLI